jgi:hypothetical protein
LSLAAFADQERSARYAGGIGLLITGASFAATGAILEGQFNEDWGSAFIITGAVLGATSIFPFLIKGPLESLARETDTKSAPELRLRWAEEARAARTSRHVSGAVALGLGAISAGTGVAIAGGAADLSKDEEEAWSLALILFGSAFFTGGVATLLVESPMETTYRATYGSSFDQASKPRLNVGVGAARGGATLAVHGAF